MVVVTPVLRERPYRGVRAADRLAARRERLLNAGLDLLGSGIPDAGNITVRDVCQQAGVAARYFYESFTDKNDFIGAVFDWAVTDLASATQTAVAAARPAEQTRAGIATIVAIITGNPRVGRLLFSTQLANAPLVHKRRESNTLFVMLSGRHVENALQVPGNDRIKATAHFVVGGVAQTISAWLDGEVALDPDQLVDQLTLLLDELANPALFGADNRQTVG